MGRKWGDKPMSPCTTLGACAADQLQCHYYQPLHILLYWQISSRSNNTLSSHLFTLYTGQQSQDRRLLAESIESATSHLSIWGSGKRHLQYPAWYICSIRNSHKIIGWSLLIFTLYPQNHGAVGKENNQTLNHCTSWQFHSDCSFHHSMHCM